MNKKKYPPETLRVFPPLLHCCAMRAEGRSQRPQVERRIRGGAALARLPVPRERQFHDRDD